MDKINLEIEKNLVKMHNFVEFMIKDTLSDLNNF